jgi:hypothetical protein
VTIWLPPGNPTATLLSGPLTQDASILDTNRNKNQTFLPEPQTDLIAQTCAGGKKYNDKGNTMARPKQRPLCLTAWLIFIIIGDLLLTPIYFLFSLPTVREDFPGVLWRILPVLGGVALFNLGCAIALFKWKKWGFWGFLASSVIPFIFNFFAGFLAALLFDLIGIAWLFAIFQIGIKRKNKYWSQLD